jgi:hypothetical protein
MVMSLSRHGANKKTQGDRSQIALVPFFFDLLKSLFFSKETMRPDALKKGYACTTK